MPSSGEWTAIIDQLRSGSMAGRSGIVLESNAFVIRRQPLLAPALSAQRPDIRTFSILRSGTSTEIGHLTLSDRSAVMYLSTAAGDWVMHSTIGAAARFEAVREPEQPPVCRFEPLERSIDLPGGRSGPGGAPVDGVFAYGSKLRRYRLAIVTTYEYFAHFPDYATAELQLIATVLDLSRTYRREFAVDFELAAYFIHTDPNDGIDPNGDRLAEAQQAVTAQFAAADYDLGHVFHNENRGGQANGGVVCNDNWKARAWTEAGDPTIANKGWRLTLMHEFGHQFAASHTMDGTAGSCQPGRFGPAAYEPLSGSTTMAYWGICENQNVSPPFMENFHVHSRQEVFNFTHYGGGNACAVILDSGNQPPTVDADPLGLDLATIPLSTPFILTGSGSDPDGETVLFSWEQYDRTDQLIASSAGLPNDTDPQAPLFRSYPPQVSPVRIFPRMESVLNNSWPNVDEALPAVGRQMTFRLTGRDQNDQGGGVAVDELTLTVDGNSGPFVVLAPNGGEVLTAGTGLAISWDPAGTGSYLPVVDIRLSIDGGHSYPYILAEDTPNDGSEPVTLPAAIPAGSNARLMVISGIASSIQFFDVSDADFSITSDCGLAALGDLGGPPVSYIDAQSPSVAPDITYLGFPADRFVFDIAEDGSAPRAPLTGYNLDRSGCETRALEDYQDIFVRVDQDGWYAFEVAAGQCHGYITLFEESLFAENDPCLSFISSNSFGGFWYCDMQAYLERGRLYRLRAYDIIGSLGTVFFYPRLAGRVYLQDPASFATPEWIALDNASGLIVAHSTTGSFDALPVGEYVVYGIERAAEVAPEDLLGKSLEDLQNEALCVVRTGNSRLIRIEAAPGVCAGESIQIDDFAEFPTNLVRAAEVITTTAATRDGVSTLLQAGEKVILGAGFRSAGPFTARIDLCEPAEPPPSTINTVLDFDGTDDAVVSTGSSALYTLDFTIEAWVQMNTLPVSNADFFVEIGEFAPDKWLWFTGVNEFGAGSIITGFRNGGTFQDFGFPFVPQVGQWYHLAVTFDNTTKQMSFYVDGYLQGVQSTAVTPGNEGNPRLWLGRQLSGGIAGHHFSGKMEEVRFWNLCRSQAQIRQYRGRELEGTEAGLLAYYKFNTPDISCTDVLDCGPNALHGARQGNAGANNLPLYEELAVPIRETTPACNADPDPCGNLPAASLPVAGSTVAGLHMLVVPNPARASFRIEFFTPEDGPVLISVYDLAGNRLHDLMRENRAAGEHQEVFSGLPLASGMYLLRLQTAGSTEVQRLVWLR